VGQGIRASWRFLIGSIMIARFWGAFTPGGFTGFGGWRIYDVAKHTGKTARATATIGVEMILGQLAFGVVVMGASVFGARFIGLGGDPRQPVLPLAHHGGDGGAREALPRAAPWPRSYLGAGPWPA
jgi:hypothetical protein